MVEIEDSVDIHEKIKIGNNLKGIKKNESPKKDGFDYLRRLFTDIFHNKKSSVCI